MSSVVQYLQISEKSNLKYFVYKVDDTVEVFNGIIGELKLKRYRYNRCIIFCRRMSDLRRIYRAFFDQLGCIYVDYKNRPFAIYHSQTSQVIKDHILKSFCEKDGPVSVLIATIAFGMGVDCKGINTIIHYRPSLTVEDYFQETGRAGRNGEQSYAVLLNYTDCTRSKNIASSMKQYVRTESFCRRKLLLSIFGVTSHKVLKELCCDICSSEDLELLRGFETQSCHDSDSEDLCCDNSSSDLNDLKCLENGSSDTSND